MIRKLLLVASLVLLPPIASAQLSPHSDIVLTSRGSPAGGASVSVCGNPGLATTGAQIIGGSIAVLTFGSNPISLGFVAGMNLTVSGFSGSDSFLNGSYTIATVTATTVSYTLAHSNYVASSNGYAFQTGTAAQACAPLSAIFSDPAGLNPITQPGFTADGLGNYFFYANSGSYNVQFGGPVLSVRVKPINIPYSPANNIAFTGNDTLGNINNVRFIDGTKFAKTAAGINAADSDCGAGTPCVIEVSYPGTYSDATIAITKQHFLRFRSYGTYVIAGIRGPDSNTDTSGFWGVECPERATLQLAASSNQDVISDTSFATLSGTGNTFGTFKITIKGCQTDGNRANQSALVTSGTGTPSTVARTSSGSGGVATIAFTGSVSPAPAVGETCNVSGITNDSGSFNGRFIAQSGTSATQLVVNQNTGKNTIASVAATGSGSVICYSGSNGIRLFGRNYWLEDLSVANNVLDDIWVEGYTPSFVNDQSELESTIRRVRTVNSGGDGMVFWGPQNAAVYDITSFQHGQWGHEVFQPIRYTLMVSYLNPSGSEHIGFGASVIETSSQESSAAAQAVLVDQGAGPSIWSGDSVFCIGCIGMTWNSSGQSFAGGIIGGGNGAAQTIGVNITNLGSGVVNAVVLNTSSYVECPSGGTPLGSKSSLDITSVDGIGHVNSSGNCTALGSPLGKFWYAKTVSQSSAADNILVLPTATISTGATGWAQTIPGGVNSTFALLGLAQAFTAAQTFNSIGNGTGLQIFNTTTTCTTAASAGATCTTAAISLPVGEADTSYRVSCTGKGPTNVPTVVSTANSSATQFTITIAALTAAAASYSSYDCVAGHN